MIPLILLGLILFVGILFGSLLLIIPGIIFMIATCFAYPALVLENLSPFQAIERSWELTKGRRLRIFGYFLLLTAIAMPIELAGWFGTLFMIRNPIVMLGIMTLIMSPIYAMRPVFTAYLFLESRQSEVLEKKIKDNSLVEVDPA